MTYTMGEMLEYISWRKKADRKLNALQAAYQSRDPILIKQAREEVDKLGKLTPA